VRSDFIRRVLLLSFLPAVVAYGQTTEPGNHASELFVPLGAEIFQDNLGGNQVRVYEQGVNTGNVVVLPWFAFETDASNKVAVITSPGSTPDRVNLTMTLLVNPAASKIKEMLVQRMRQEAGAQLGNRQALFSSITEGKIIPASTKEISVSEVNYDGAHTFSPLLLQDFEGVQLPISISIPKSDATSVESEIREGQRWFDISYRIAAKRISSESFAEVQHETICQTDALRDIFGDGGAIDPHSLKPALITRQQKLALQGSIIRKIGTTYDIQNPQDLALLEPVVNKYLESLFKEQELLLDKPWTLLATYGFSRKDIDPDTGQKFVKTMRDKVEEHREKEFSFSSSASASFCGFGGSGSLSSSGKSLKDHKEEHELAIDIQGDIGIPKGLKVYSLDSAALKTTGLFTTTLRRSYSSLARQRVILSTGPSVRPVTTVAPLESMLRTYSTLPIGSIIPFVGDQNILAGTGWLLCDGTDLPADADPSLRASLKGKTPSLNTPQGVFLAGLPMAQRGEAGGRWDIPGTGAISITGTMRTKLCGADYQNIKLPHYNASPIPGGCISWSFVDAHDGPRGGWYFENGYWPLDINGLPSHDHGGDNRPPYYGVSYIIRVR
jgi:hypothetical protein